jgi:hypothetical protein
LEREVGAGEEASGRVQEEDEKVEEELTYSGEGMLEN